MRSKRTFDFAPLLAAIFLGACGSAPEPAPAPAPAQPGVMDNGGPELLCSGTSPHTSDLGNNLQTHRHCLGEMYPDASAQSYGDGAGINVYVSMHLVLGGDFMVVSDDDRLTATLAGETRDLTYDDSSGRVRYVAAFSSATSGNVTIDFLRSSPLRSAHMTIPVAQDFIVSGGPETIKLSDVVHFDVAPAPASGAVGVYVDGACVVGTKSATQPSTIPVMDGAAAYAAMDLMLGVSNCDVTTHVRVETAGTVDRLFWSGTAAGLQERRFTSRFSP